jgi:hypothetical protein
VTQSQYSPQADQPPRIAMSPKNRAPRPRPTPSPKPRQPRPLGPPAQHPHPIMQLVPPRAIGRPPPDGLLAGPGWMGSSRIMSQTLMPSLSRCERRSSFFQNLETSSSTTSTQEATLSECSSVNFTVEDSTAQSAASSSAMSAWRRAVIRIPLIGDFSPLDDRL